MKKINTTFLLTTIFCLSACGPATKDSELNNTTTLKGMTFEDVVVEELPEWTAKYEEDRQPSFDIDKLMMATDLPRVKAVEIQSLVLEMYADSKGRSNLDTEAMLQKAVAQVKSGYTRSGVSVERLKRAKFIAVFDLDETLYDQFVSKDNACANLSMTTSSGRRIVQNPGWMKSFDMVRQAGGEVVIFSAFPDSKVFENLSKWQWKGQPLVRVNSDGSIATHRDIAGVMGNSFLVRSPAVESNGRKSTPSIKRVKDLRLFDEKLSKVALIDDNPRRVMFDQMHFSLVNQKFDGDLFCNARQNTSSQSIAEMYSTGVVKAVAEFVESVNYATNSGMSIQQALLPYSFMGEIAVRSLVETGRVSQQDAINLVRQNPQMVARYF